MSNKYLVVQAFWYFDRVTGEFHYRISKPGSNLSKVEDFTVVDVHIFHPLFPQLALDCDLLILHLLPDAELNQVISLRKKAGKPTLYELADNYMNLGAWIPSDDAHRNPRIRQNFLFYASLCDGLQFSTEEVRRTLGFLNPENMVFENQIDHFGEVTPRQDKFIFGWGGSKGHDEDLAFIAPVIHAFCRSHPDAVFAYMGYLPMYEKHFADLPKDQVIVRQPGPIEEYYEFLHEIQVGIAPLMDTEFNRCRSDVKFLEYAAHGALPVLADAPPYRTHARHGENALLFKTPEDLRAILEDLYANPDKTHQLTQKSFEYVSTQRTYKVDAERRAACYRRFINKDPHVVEVPPLPDCKGLTSMLQKTIDFYMGEKYTEALAQVEKLIQVFPGYQSAHLWHAKVLLALRRNEEILNTYIKFEINPIFRDLVLEVLTVAARRLGRAEWRKYWEAIEEPCLKLYQSEMYDKNPTEVYRQMLAHNPYHYEALVNLAKHEAFTAGNPSGALELAERAYFMHRESAELGALVENLREKVKSEA